MPELHPQSELPSNLIIYQTEDGERSRFNPLKG